MTVSAVLCWSEYYNGKWQPQKSSDVNRPAVLGDFDTNGDHTFDAIRNLVQIVPGRVAVTYAPVLDPSGAYIAATGNVQNTLPNDALILSISNPLSTDTGFVLFNTHSLPVQWNDVTLPVTTSAGTFKVPLSMLVLPANPSRTLPTPLYTGGETSGSFSVSYWSLAGDPNNAAPKKAAGPTNTGNIHVAIGATTPVIYQGTTVYPTGQAAQQAGQVLAAGSTTKPAIE